MKREKIFDIIILKYFLLHRDNNKDKIQLNMNIYKIGGMIFGISSPDDSYVKMCHDYEHTKPLNSPLDFTVNITSEDIENEKRLYSYPCSSAMANSSSIYRYICREAIKRGGFFLHSAVIEYEGFAYAFLAPSGTGKSTHIKLWRKLLGKNVSIVNGDKPLIMPHANGEFYAYGTPWSGKEGWQRNVFVKMGAICILKRGETNKIREISSIEALQYMLKQTLIPNEKDEVEKLLENIDNFLSGNIRCYMLECNMELDAASVSFEKMTGKDASKYLNAVQNKI